MPLSSAQNDESYGGLVSHTHEGGRSVLVAPCICAGERVCGPDIPAGSERTMRNGVVKVPCTGTAGATCTIELLPDASAAGRAADAAVAAAGSPRVTKRAKPKKIRRTGVVVLKLVVTGSGRKLIGAAPGGRLPVRARATVVARDGVTRVSEVPFLLLSPRRGGKGS
jgi:hypothetical protein